MSPSVATFPRANVGMPMPAYAPMVTPVAQGYWNEEKPQQEKPQQLMAKALADLYARIPPQDVARFTNLLATLSQKGGKLSDSDHVMLSQVIRMLEDTVQQDVEKLTKHDDPFSTDFFSTPTASTLVSVDEDLPGLSPRYAPSSSSNASGDALSLEELPSSRMMPLTFTL